MPSLGILGAIGGGAKGFAESTKMDMEEARETRLANLRNKNAQETNTMNNQQRTDNRMAEIGQQNTDRLAQQDQANQYSLESLAKGDEYKQAQTQQAQDVKTAAEPNFRQEYDESGTLTGQVNERTNEWSTAGSTAKTSANQLPSDAKMLNYLTGDKMGMSNDEALTFLKQSTGDSPEGFRRKLMKSYADSGYQASEISTEVEALMKIAYPDNAGGGAGGEIPTMTAEEAGKAKPGTQFRTTDGRLMRVPG